MTDDSNNSVQIWDIDDALKRVRGKQDRLMKLVNLFLADAEKHKQAIDEAIKSGNCEQAALETHSVKGAAGNVSGLRLYHQAVTLESALKAGNAEQSAVLWPEFASAYDELNDHFRAWLAENSE